MKNQDSPNRSDLTDEEIVEIESLKSSLVQPLDDELALSPSILDSNNISSELSSILPFNTSVASYSISAPVTPVSERSVSVLDRVLRLEYNIRASSTPALATLDVAPFQSKSVIEQVGTMSSALKEALAPQGLGDTYA